MPQAFIDSITLCDSNENPFPIDPGLGVPLVPFPGGMGRLSLILIVQCHTNSTGNEEVFFAIRYTGNTNDYRMLSGTNNTVSFFRQVQGDTIVKLPFDMEALQPVQNLPVTSLVLRAKAAPPSQSDKGDVFIKGIE